MKGISAKTFGLQIDELADLALARVEESGSLGRVLRELIEGMYEEKTAWVGLKTELWAKSEAIDRQLLRLSNPRQTLQKLYLHSASFTRVI